MNGKKRVLMCCGRYETDKLVDVIRKYLGYRTIVPTYRIEENGLYNMIAKIEEKYDIPDGMVICFPNGYDTDNYDRWIFILKKLGDYYTIFDWRRVILNSVVFPSEFLQIYFETGEIVAYSKIQGMHCENVVLTKEDKDKMISEYRETRQNIQALLEKTVREWRIVVKLEKIGREVIWINDGVRDKNYQRIEELEDWIIEELCEQKQ